MAAALLVSLAPGPAVAGTSTITAPRIVYTGVNDTISFSGSDAVSGESRAISMDASISASCDPNAGNGWSADLCGRVQIGLNDAYGGTLFLDGTEEVAGSPGVWKTASGALIDGDNPTDPVLRGGPVLSINMNGTLDQLNGALGDLQYIPATGFEDRYYDEETPPGAGVPRIDILVNDGSLSATNASTEIVLRVEATNGGPTLAGPAGALSASAGVENDYPADPSDPAVLSVVDPELCLGNPNNRCDGAYPDGPVLPEPNDAMLLVMWLAENSCGQFELRSTSGFTNFGGAALPSVNAILTAPTGLDLEQDAADAILATLGSAGGVDLSSQSGGLTTVFAATAGSIEDVRYALSQLTYDAPADDATCHLNIAFSDLGNNGMPDEWIDAPEHEIPNAKADTISVTFEVTDTQPAVTIDQIVPSQGGDPAGPNKPSGFTITFADPIDPASFDASDLDLSTSSASGAALGLLTPVVAGTSYTVPVTASGDGTLTLTMAAGAACADGHFSGTCDAGFGSEEPTYDDNEITWDQTGPTPTITVKAGQADPTAGSTVTFEVDADETFSSAPASFDGSDIDLTGSTATTGAPTVTWQGLGSPSTFDVVVPVTSTGTVVAKVAADAYVDTALNGNEESGTATVTVDQTEPTVVVAKDPGQADPTSTSPILFSVTFSEDVSGLDDADVDFTGSTAGGTLAASVSGGPTAFDVAVSGMTTSGDVVISLPAGAAEDALGNSSEASNQATVGWVQVVDLTPPDVTIDQAAGQDDPTSVAGIEYTAVFSEPVSGFTDADVSFAGSTVAGTLSAAVSGGPSTYSVTVTGMTGSGTVVVSIPAGAAKDAADNDSTASTSTDAEVEFDLTPPDVTIDQAAGQADPTSTSPISFEVVFSEPVTGFATGDVTLGGTAGATTATVSGSGAAYTVSVTGMTASGTVTASLAAGVAADGAGNPSTASTSTDNAVTWEEPPADLTPPDVTIDQAAGQADPAYGDSVAFRVTFSEPVTGFGPEDVILGGSASPTTAAVSGGPAIYTVTVSGMGAPGTVTIAIAAGGALDMAGNPNTGSTASDSSVTWLGTRPVPSPTIPPTDAVDRPAATGHTAGSVLPLVAAILGLLSLVAFTVPPARLRRRR